MKELEPERYELLEPPLYVFRVNRRQFLGAGFVAVFLAQGAPGPEARIHLSDDGIVTVLSGKVEEGQGARTEFAMAAAEELGVPLERVRVMMADTDVTPNDGITAGSRSTPANVPAVRKAAAALRKVALPEGWQVLGKPVHRVNARDLVTGEHVFPSDVVREGMLHGAVLRAPSWGATLVSAEGEHAGVTVVRDGDFVGCVAPSSYSARKAVASLAATAKWKEKPGQPANAGLAEHFRTNARGGAVAPTDAPHRATYTTAYIHHAPMEPRAAVAEWADGRVTVWTGTSNPFSVCDQVAQAFGIAATNVRVIVPDFGGGFGGKHTGEAAIEAARLAKAAGKPVKVRWTRAEEFMWSYARPAALIEAEAALDADKRIALWNFVNYNSGGSALESPYKSAGGRVRHVQSDSPVRQGSYRALAATANTFARECFIDELAAAAGMDPLAFRLANLGNERIRAVLVEAARKFGWEERSRQKRPGRGVGLACGTEKNSVVAACVEVEVDATTGAPRLLEICEAYECGRILNPAGLKQQVEGAILMGLGAALREELLFENGRLKNGRFATYRVPRFRDVPPKIDVVLMDRKHAESNGAGETPIIAVAPAMANAIFMATGERRRSLPLRRG